MTDARLTIELAVRAMGWRTAPGKFLTSPDRSWIPMHQFQPLEDLAGAFKLLAHSNAKYTMAHLQDGVFSARVLIESRRGTATADCLPRAISLAVARAIGIDMEGAE